MANTTDMGGCSGTTGGGEGVEGGCKVTGGGTEETGGGNWEASGGASGEGGESQKYTLSLMYTILKQNLFHVPFCILLGITYLCG